MHKYRALLEFHEKHLSLEAAAELLGTEEKHVLQMHTLWKDQLPKLAPMIDDLIKGSNTKKEQADAKRRIAKYLKITHRQVNRLLETSGITIPTPKSIGIREEKAKKAKEKLKTREKHALDVVAGLNSVEEAAIAAEVTARQMYRKVGKLCDRVGIVFSDLKGMGPGTRTRLVRRLERMLEEGVEQEAIPRKATPAE